MAAEPKDFIDYVQQHEREWGNETYSGRPSLDEILRAPVVIFWQPVDSKSTNGRRVVTLHNDLKEVQEHLEKLLIRSQLEFPRQRIYRMFAKGKQIRIKAVHVEFEVAKA